MYFAMGDFHFAEMTLNVLNHFGHNVWVDMRNLRVVDVPRNGALSILKIGVGDAWVIRV